MYILSVRHITAFLYLGILDITSAQCLGIILMGEIKRHKIMKTVTLKRLRKGHLFIVYSMRAETRKQSIAQSGNACQVTQIFSTFCMCP